MMRCRLGSCILSKFYIKPQQRIRHKIGHSCCILSKFYIKPQPTVANIASANGCILSKFYIKPQPRRYVFDCPSVVSYRNSTSNHNERWGLFMLIPLYLIEILHQTTTRAFAFINRMRLYLIEILHQTTTANEDEHIILVLYLIEILHQTTTSVGDFLCSFRCILSKFYIKPQLSANRGKSWKVVSYRNSTSNHNIMEDTIQGPDVVSYRNSTSNHNSMSVESTYRSLYLIEILHQTTTDIEDNSEESRLYLIEILHQTTTPARARARALRCILSKFYIKPQHWRRNPRPRCVVSYRNSTSNHNFFRAPFCRSKLYLIEILHQTTTKNGEVE